VSARTVATVRALEARIGAEPHSGRRSATRIVIRDGWPFTIPALIVEGLHTNHLTERAAKIANFPDVSKKGGSGGDSRQGVTTAPEDQRRVRGRHGRCRKNSGADR
jgi:hypothetical protein